MIRGAVYRIDLGEAKRGHEQRGKRYGVLVSPSNWPSTVATFAPTSTSATWTLFRPEIEIGGTATRVMIDQIRTIDTSYVGDLVGALTRMEMAEVEHAMAHYLGVGFGKVTGTEL